MELEDIVSEEMLTTEDADKEHENTKKELAKIQKNYQKLSGEKEILQGLADRYNRLLRMLGKEIW